MRHDIRLLEVSADTLTSEEIERLQTLVQVLVGRMEEIEEVTVIKGNVCWKNSGEEVAD